VLRENSEKSFIGNIILGMGFTFDDNDKKGIATPLVEMRSLIEKDPRNAQCIFPYLGGEDFLNDPRQSHSRYVINFGDMSESEARRWPDLFAIVEHKVKPERLLVKRKALRERWWQFAEKQPALHRAIQGRSRVLMHPFTSTHLAFGFVPTTTVVAGPHNVLVVSTYAGFCALQSRPHELWARFFASSMEDRLRYTTSDCFQTFPFPVDWETSPALEAAGSSYYEFRASLMVDCDEGLTKTYNRFHDPEERDPRILKLRELHAFMDRALLDEYGWTDIRAECEFLLDYDIEEEEWGNKKRPYRFRWPDEVRDEVLARLLELNAARARKELIHGAATSKQASTKSPSHSRKSVEDATGDLFS
jgi:hypothetical protein